MLLADLSGFFGRRGYRRRGVPVAAACAGCVWGDPPPSLSLDTVRRPCSVASGKMVPPRCRLVSALSVVVTLLLLTAASCGSASGTRVRPPQLHAKTVGRAGAAAGAARPPDTVPPVAAKVLFPLMLDLKVMSFLATYSTLGVSMDELMDAERASNLGQYEVEINTQRNSSLSMTLAISLYRTIMQTLHSRGRCLDFVRQSTLDDPAACGLQKWRRCCRGTANDADQVLLCATHENLFVSPPFSLATQPANSFRVKPLPLRVAVRDRITVQALRRRALLAAMLSLNSSTARELEHREERHATVGLSGTFVARATAVDAPAVAHASAMGPAKLPRSVPTTARQDTVLPLFFEDQFAVQEETETDEAWLAWCREFLYYGAGCVEYCCTTLMAGSAVCNTAKDPDECI
ncbi:hypothetical protein I4F81_003512 [Pyropia yezoensis]|uniref:Uncharacterized protein n=1 Tax=Pyropia yezoensis TaxID=2788 RepID=A0ACC3BSB8_PYRYE|nr:hypothetical protein I4F81_003512 [Neopyropia yezoensis]